MEIPEYNNIYENEFSHFYYVITHKIINQLLKSHRSSFKKIKILDAGCGCGLLMKKLKKYGGVWGIDLSSEAIKYCRQRGLNNLKQESILKTSFNNNFFDVIVCIDVLYHKQVKNDNQALLEFYRILKPGGILILKLPAYNFLKNDHDIIVHTKHRYTKMEINNKLIKQGFKVTKTTYAFSYLLPFLIGKKIIYSLGGLSSPTSSIQKIPALVNNLFKFIGNFESHLLVNHSLPVGTSIFIVAQKPFNNGSK